MKAPVKVLVVDIGGTRLKILATGQTERRRFPSGKTMTPRKMVVGVKRLAKNWKYDVVLGGGNAKKLRRLPLGCRVGDNANAFLGGFRLWKETKS